MAEEIGIEFTAEGADQVRRDIEEVADAVESLEDGATVRVEAETEQAERAARSLEEQLDDLTDDGRELRIEFRAQTLRRQVATALRDLERLEDPVEIEARTDDLERAQKELRDLAELADRKYDIEIDADPKRSVRTAADGVDELRVKGEGLQSAIPAIRGFGDELGGAAQGAGIASQAVADLGDFSLIAGERFAASGSRMSAVATRLGTVLGAAGLAGAIAGIGVQIGQLALPALQRWIGGTEETIEANEELAESFDSVAAALKNRDYEGAVRAIVDQYGELIDAGARLGVSTAETARFILGLDDAALQAGVGVDTTSEAWRQFSADLEFVRDGVVRAQADLQNLDRIAPEIGRDLLSDALANAESLDEYQQILLEAAEAMPELYGQWGPAMDPAVQSADAVESAVGDVEQAAIDARNALNWEQNVLRTERTALQSLENLRELGVNATRLDIVNAKLAVDEWAQSLENLPEDVQTEVQTLIDEGSYRLAQARLAVLTARETKTIDVYVPGVTPLPASGSAGPNGGVGNIPDNIEGYGLAQSTVIVNPPPELVPRGVAESGLRYDRLNGGRGG